MVPGQRIVETDLAVQFGVGRNAVREAMQQLAIRGVVDLSPNRSASIRNFDLHQTLEVLVFAVEFTSLSASISSRNYDPLLLAFPFSPVILSFFLFFTRLYSLHYFLSLIPFF